MSLATSDLADNEYQQTVLSNEELMAAIDRFNALLQTEQDAEENTTNSNLTENTTDNSVSDNVEEQLEEWEYPEDIADHFGDILNFYKPEEYEKITDAERIDKTAKGMKSISNGLYAPTGGTSWLIECINGREDFDSLTVNCWESILYGAILGGALSPGDFLFLTSECFSSHDLLEVLGMNASTPYDSETLPKNGDVLFLFWDAHVVLSLGDGQYQSLDNTGNYIASLEEIIQGMTADQVRKTNVISTLMREDTNARELAARHVQKTVQEYKNREINQTFINQVFNTFGAWKRKPELCEAICDFFLPSCARPHPSVVRVGRPAYLD